MRWLALWALCALQARAVPIGHQPHVPFSGARPAPQFMDYQPPVEKTKDNKWIDYDDQATVVGISPSNGPYTGGMVVTLTGRLFGEESDAITNISIKGVLCTNIGNVSNHSVMCTTGNARGKTLPGPGDVFVTTGKGGKSKSVVQYTYQPAPVVKKIAQTNPLPYPQSLPTNGPTNGGTRLTLSGDNLAPEGLDDVQSIKVAGLPCLDVNYPASACKNDVSTWDTTNGITGYQLDHMGYWSSFSKPIQGCTEDVIGAKKCNDAPGCVGFSRNTATNICFTFTDTAQSITTGKDKAYIKCPPIKPSADLECTTPDEMDPGLEEGIIITTVSGGVGISNATFLVNIVPLVQDISPRDGPSQGDTAVTISGLGLGRSKADITEVMVGKAQCIDVKWVNSTMFTCTTQPSDIEKKPQLITLNTLSGGAGITGSTKNVIGQDVFFTDFTYNPPPEISVVGPTNGPATEAGLEVKLTGRYLGTDKDDIIEIYFMHVDEATCQGRADVPCKPKSQAKTMCDLVEWLGQAQIKCALQVSSYSGLGIPFVRTKRHGLGTHKDAVAGFTFNAPPRVTKVTDAKQGLLDVLELEGKEELAKSQVDIVSVTVAGVLCMQPALSIDKKMITCVPGECVEPRCTPGAPSEVIVTTTSGSKGTADVKYTPGVKPDEPDKCDCLSAPEKCTCCQCEAGSTVNKAKTCDCCSEYAPGSEACKNDNGVVGYNLDHEGYWKSSTTQPVAANDAACAKICDDVDGCVGFSRNKANGACSTYIKVDKSLEIKTIHDNAYKKCPKGGKKSDWVTLPDTITCTVDEEGMCFTPDKKYCKHA